MNTMMKLGMATLCTAAVAMPAQAGRGESVVYELGAESSYIEGCFGLCLCAIFYFGDVEGTMTFTPQSLSGTADIYDVSDVQWQVNLFGMPGGPIYTGVSEAPQVEAVRISGGRFAVVGSLSDARARSRGAREINLGGAAAFPGFTATLVHAEQFRPGRPQPTHRLPNPAAPVAVA